MPDVFTIKVDTSVLNRFTREFPAQVMPVLGEILRTEMLFFLEELREQRLTGNPVKVRTGDLRRDGLAVLQPPTDRVVQVNLVWTLPYAATQEFGDPDRRPRHAKFLAIPLPAALTARGVARYPSPLRVSLARAFPEGTFVRGTYAGGRAHKQAILFGVRNGQLVPLFVLKRSVSIPPRMGARAFLRQYVTDMPKRIEAALTAKLPEMRTTGPRPTPPPQ